MPARTCLVTVIDQRGIRHTAEVVAESMFEAAVLGLAAFRKDDWTEKIGPATRLHVAVHEPVVSHTLTVQQIHRWLEGATISPNELVLKKKLKEMLARPSRGTN